MQPYLPRYDDLFNKAPQHALFTQARKEQFVNVVNGFEPELLERFHIARLGGFGGSEMPVVIGEEFGEFNRYKSRRTLVAEKLLMAMPTPSSGHALRGKLFEEPIRTKFRQSINTPTFDREIEKLSRFQHPTLPWMKARLDDYVEINGKRYIADYKAPNNDDFVADYDNNGVIFAYAVQLHHYYLIAKAAGIDVDGVLLVSGIINDQPMALDVREVEIQPQILEAIETMGNQIWTRNVMLGELPTFTPRHDKLLDITVPENQNLASLCEQVAVLKSIGSDSEKRAKELIESIKTDLDEKKFTTKVSHHGMDLIPKETLNTDVVLLLAEKYGIDTSQFKPEPTPDVKKMQKKLKALEVPETEFMSIVDEVDMGKLVAHLQEVHGHDPKEFETFGYQVALTKGKHSVSAQHLESVKDLAKGQIDQFMATILAPHLQSLIPADAVLVESSVEAVAALDLPEGATAREVVEPIDPSTAKPLIEDSPVVETEVATAPVIAPDAEPVPVTEVAAPEPEAEEQARPTPRRRKF